MCLQGNSSSRSGSAAQLSPGCFSPFSQNSNPSNTQNAGSISVSDYQSFSPGSVEVSSDTVDQINGNEHYDSIDGTGGIGTTKVDVNQALRKLEEQLSLNEDSFKEFESPSQVEGPNDPDLLKYEGQIHNQNVFVDFNGPESIVGDQCYSGHAGVPGDTFHLVFLSCWFFYLFLFFCCIGFVENAFVSLIGYFVVLVF